MAQIDTGRLATSNVVSNRSRCSLDWSAPAVARKNSMSEQRSNQPSFHWNRPKKLVNGSTENKADTSEIAARQTQVSMGNVNDASKITFVVGGDLTRSSHWTHTAHNKMKARPCSTTALGI